MLNRTEPPSPDRQSDPSTLYNPFQERLRLMQRLDHSLALIQTVLPIDLLTAATNGDPWWHYGFNPCIGSLVGNASILAPMRLAVDTPTHLTLILVYAGFLQVEQAGRQVACVDEGVLLLPGTSWRCQSSACSLVMLPIERQRLQNVALAMAERRQLPQSWRERLETSLPWQANANTGSSELGAGLRQVLTIANQLSDQSSSLVARLELDLLIYRLLAALVIPELRCKDPLDRVRSRQREGSDRFEELIAYLKNHLHEPLSLHLLEEQSHYSRRALQYAFLERLGCSPTQWIREMRLDKARRCLQQPEPSDSVTSIAQACGYRSINLFTIDFEQRFHVKPSDLLRESRLPASGIAPTDRPEDPDLINEV